MLLWVGRVVREDHPAPHRLEQRLWLLEYLLLHEVIKVSLHDLLHVHIQPDQFRVPPGHWVCPRAGRRVVKGQLAIVDVDHVAVFQDDDLVRVLDDGRRVAREEVLQTAGLVGIIPLVRYVS